MRSSREFAMVLPKRDSCASFKGMSERQTAAQIAGLAPLSRRFCVAPMMDGVS
jgi:hypothetical protein